MNINETMRELAQYTRLQEEALKDLLKQYMSENQLEILTGDEHKATYKTVSTSRIDTSALKRDMPAVAAQYSKTTETRCFTFS